MKKRVGVITFLHNNNYGSTLQAWALQKTLKDLGVDAEHIDYQPSQREKLINLLKNRNSPALILEGLRKRHPGEGTAAINFKKAAIQSFQREHMKLSSRCSNKKQLELLAANYDLLIAGSDQIWSPEWLNTSYYLDFSGNTPKASYAASLGVSGLPGIYKQKRIRKCLNGFKAVSVREKAGADLLFSLTGKRFPVMPDPVLLVDREEWLRISKIPEGLRNRLVCYFIGESPEYWQQVRKMAEEMNLEPLVIPVTAESCAQGLEVRDQISVETWIGLIAGAGAVITDSFHGSAFAALLHTPCCILRRWQDKDKASKNSRIDQLMLELHLLSDGIREPADFEQVDKNLERLKKQAVDYLASVLSD